MKLITFKTYDIGASLQLCTTFVFWETYGFWTAFFCYCFSWFSIYMLLFMFLNLEVNHHYCIGFIWEDCLLYAMMPVSIEQWCAEIGCFNGCSLHSVVKLHINLFNLLVNIFLVSFCIIAITIYYITKFQFFLYLTTIFLYNFLPFLSASISCSNSSHFSKFIFIKRSSTNYLYITSFIDVVYSIYFLHILLLQHWYRSQSWNSKTKKEKPLLLPLECQQPYNINYPRFLSLKHIIQFINMILSVYLKCSLTFQCKKGPKTFNCMATVWSGQIIQVIQNEVVFVSFTRKL